MYQINSSCFKVNQMSAHHTEAEARDDTINEHYKNFLLEQAVREKESLKEAKKSKTKEERKKLQQ